MNSNLAEDILDQIPSTVRFNDEDAATILKHKDLMLSWEDGLVQGFYDNVFGHATTRAVFKEGERKTREESLANWYQRTVSGPFNTEYWEWQTYVGLIHIKRGVNNAMVSGMWGWMMTYLGAKALNELSAEEALPLIKAVHSLQSAVMALIAESYQRNMFVAVGKSAGIGGALLNRLIDLEIDEMLVDAKA